MISVLDQLEKASGKLYDLRLDDSDDWRAIQKLEREIDSLESGIELGENMKTKQNYKIMLRQARKFVEVLSGDMRYTDPKVNYVALVSMLVGWMHSWPVYTKFAVDLSYKSPRDNPGLFAVDFASEVAYDVTMGNCDYDNQ